jgi:hypothetical protein
VKSVLRLAQDKDDIDDLARAAQATSFSQGVNCFIDRDKRRRI